MASDFGKMADRIGRMARDLPDEHADATEDAVDGLQTSVIRHLIANESIARRKLITDVRHTTGDGDADISRSVHVPDWAKYLEHGTGPRGQTDTLDNHMSFPKPTPGPPTEDIETWIIAKNVTSARYETPGALADVIQESIGTQGTFPHPFMRPAWHGSRGYRNVVDANARALRRLLRRL